MRSFPRWFAVYFITIAGFVCKADEVVDDVDAEISVPAWMVILYVAISICFVGSCFGLYYGQRYLSDKSGSRRAAGGSEERIHTKYKGSEEYDMFMTVMNGEAWMNRGQLELVKVMKRGQLEEHKLIKEWMEGEQAPIKKDHLHDQWKTLDFEDDADINFEQFSELLYELARIVEGVDDGVKRSKKTESMIDRLRSTIESSQFYIPFSIMLGTMLFIQFRPTAAHAEDEDCLEVLSNTSFMLASLIETCDCVKPDILGAYLNVSFATYLATTDTTLRFLLADSDFFTCSP